MRYSVPAAFSNYHLSFCCLALQIDGSPSTYFHSYSYVASFSLPILHSKTPETPHLHSLPQDNHSLSSNLHESGAQGSAVS